MRGADGGPWNRICALPALWVGLLYDQGALDAAWDLVKGWSIEEQQALRDTVPRDGMSARSEEHTSEFQSLMRISFAVFCLKKTRHYLYRITVHTTADTK